MRVFVFRPQADAERSARALTAHGHEPVTAPLFDVVRLQDPAPEGEIDALVLTSGNAVPALADAPAAWRDKPVFTVGARTAEKARAAGFGDARSADGDRDDLVALIVANLPAKARLLLVLGRDRHDEVPSRLADAGYEAIIWTAYAAQALPELPEAAATLLRDGGAEAALHYSPRGAEVFLALAREAGLLEPALGLTHVAMSAEVAAPLVAAGASTVLVAEHPEEAALLAALDQVSARHRSHADATGAADRAAGIAEADGDAVSGKGKATTTPRLRSRRTPPTIEMKAQESSTSVTTPETAEAASEALLPTEALPQEVPGAGEIAAEKTVPKAATPPASDTDATPPPPPDFATGRASPPPEPARERSSLPMMALAGLVGGVIGAGLVMLALSRADTGAREISAQQIADLRSRIEALQASTAGLPNRAAVDAIDVKASAAAAAAAKAGTEAQVATARLGELATAQRAQAPDAGAIAGLSQQAQANTAAATALNQRLDQTAARIGNVETLAKTAAAPSPQALAAARVVLSERVQTAIASGQPFATDVAALAKGGGAPEQLAALNAVAETGAATNAALQAQFKAHRALFVREMTPADAGWQDKLAGLASRVITIRPVGETGGDDRSTLVIRLENAIMAGQAATAATLWGQLPEPARQASADLGENLKKRTAAEAAIAKIAQDAVAALGAAG